MIDGGSVVNEERADSPGFPLPPPQLSSHYGYVGMTRADGENSNILILDTACTNLIFIFTLNPYFRYRFTLQFLELPPPAMQMLNSTHEDEPLPPPPLTQANFFDAQADWIPRNYIEKGNIRVSSTIIARS